MIGKLKIFIFLILATGLLLIDQNLISSTAPISTNDYQIIKKGKEFYKQKKYSQAINEWDKIASAGRLTPEIKKLMGKAYKKMHESKITYYKGVSLYKENKLEEAEKYFSKATNIYPENIEAAEKIFVIEKYQIINKYNNNADNLLKEGKTNEALNLYKKVLKTDYNNEIAKKKVEHILTKKKIEVKDTVDKFLVEGITHFSNNSYQEAQKSFIEILKVDQNNIIAVNYLENINAIIMQHKGSNLIVKETATNVDDIPAEELKKYQKEYQLPQLAPINIITERYLKIAKIYFYEKFYNNSHEICEKILTIDPENDEVANLITKITISRINDKAEMEKYLLTAKAIELMDEKEYIPAKRIFESLLEIEPGNYMIINYIDEINIKLKKQASINKNQSNKYNNMNYTNALKYILVSKKIDPKSKEAAQYIDIIESGFSNKKIQTPSYSKYRIIFIIIYIISAVLLILFLRIIIDENKITRINAIIKKINPLTYGKTDNDSFRVTVKEQFIGNKENLVDIRNFIEKYLRKTPLKKKEVYRLKLAVDEACSNIITHGYKRSTNKSIDIGLIRETKKISIIIEDHGKKFNPLDYPETDLENYKRKYKSSGLGIYIIRHLVDELIYHSIKGCGNKIELIKYF